MNTAEDNRTPSSRKAAKKFKENISKPRRSPNKKTVILSLKRKVKIYEFKESYLRKHTDEPFPLSTRAYQAELTAYLHAYDSAITAAVVSRWLKAHLWITVAGLNGGVEDCVVQFDPPPTTRSESAVVDSGVVYSSRRPTPTNGYVGPEGENIDTAAPLNFRAQTVTLTAGHLRATALPQIFRAHQNHDQVSSSSGYTIRPDTPIPASTSTYIRPSLHTPVTSSSYSCQEAPSHGPVTRYNFSPPISVPPQNTFPGHSSTNNTYQSYVEPQPGPSSRFHEPTNPSTFEAERNGNSTYRLYCPGGSSNLHNGHYRPSRNMHYDNPYPSHYQYANELPPHFPQMGRPTAHSTATGDHNGVNNDAGNSSNYTNPISSSSDQLSDTMREMKRIMSSVILNPRQSIGRETIVDKHTRITYTLQCMKVLCSKMPTLKIYANDLERCAKVFTRQVSKEIAPVSHLDAFRGQYPMVNGLKIKEEPKPRSDDDESDDQVFQVAK